VFYHFSANVKPDILTTAKGCTGAYTPVGITATTAEIRSYFEDRFFSHGHTHAMHPLVLALIPAAIEEYKPALRGLTPIAIVGLVIRDQAGKREQISFQVGFEALEKLIMRLQACQKEMRLLQQIQQQLEVETDERQGSC